MIKKYEWDTWLKRNDWVTLTKGTHFDCTLRMMKQQVRNAARAANMLVKIKQLDKKSFQFRTSKRGKFL